MMTPLAHFAPSQRKRFQVSLLLASLSHVLLLIGLTIIPNFTATHQQSTHTLNITLAQRENKKPAQADSLLKSINKPVENPMIK